MLVQLMKKTKEQFKEEKEFDIIETKTAKTISSKIPNPISIMMI